MWRCCRWMWSFCSNDVLVETGSSMVVLVLQDVEDVLVDVEVLLLNVKFLIAMWMMFVDPVPNVVALLEEVLVDVEVLLLYVEFLLGVGDVLVD